MNTYRKKSGIELLFFKEYYCYKLNIKSIQKKKKLHLYKKWNISW